MAKWNETAGGICSIVAIGEALYRIVNTHHDRKKVKAADKTAELETRIKDLETKLENAPIKRKGS